MFRVGDRVTYRGMYAEITRLRGGYRADIYFGTLDGKPVVWENVPTDDLTAEPAIITSDVEVITRQKQEKESYRHNGR